MMQAKENSFNFVKEEIRLTIPFFQRQYVWEKKHWEQFFDDLYASFHSQKEHFLGSVVLKRQQGNRNEALVIDGQQRLTTFSILIKALCNNLEEEQKKYFRDLLFETYTEAEPKIKHSKLDREKFTKVLQNSTSINLEEKEGIFGCFAYFLNRIRDNLDKNEIFDFIRFVVESKLWVVVCLDSNEDEQKIFDSINSTGERLTATDIIKNSLFDGAIKLFGNDEAIEWHKRYWEDIFESDDTEKAFWDKTIEKLERTRSESLLYSMALIEGFFNIDKDNLGNLSSIFKKKIETLKTKEAYIDFLSKINTYGKIYRNFPQINKNTVFYYEDWEMKFFHIIETTQTTTIFPLIIFLKNIILDKNIEKECFYLLEMLILCNDDTKNYNKFFVKIIENIIANSITENELPNYIKTEISKTYQPCFLRVKDWLNSITNRDAKLVLFWIEAWREFCKKDFKDKIGLQYTYTLEHLMPQSWKENWGEMCQTDDEANLLIYQIGNMTLLKGSLNKTLKNSNWNKKLNGDGKARNYIKNNADLLITTELFDKATWDSTSIQERTEALYSDFKKIWNIDLFIS